MDSFETHNRHRLRLRTPRVYTNFPKRPFDDGQWNILLTSPAAITVGLKVLTPVLNALASTQAVKTKPPSTPAVSKQSALHFIYLVYALYVRRHKL